jgi:hypothetical protein
LTDVPAFLVRMDGVVSDQEVVELASATTAHKGEPMLWDGDTLNNLWDTLPYKWLWIGAAAVLVVLFWTIAAYKSHKSKSSEAIQDQQEGWTPTGRIDLSDRQTIGIFVLQAEDTRAVNSVGGVEHREIRWRNATLDEAKTVVVAYHAQRNLAMTSNFVVNSSVRRKSDLDNEHQKPQLAKDEPPDEKS